MVRAAWSARMDELRGALDLAASFRESGRTWVELGDAGQVVERGARTRRSPKPSAIRTAAKTTTPSRATKATKAVKGAGKPAAKRARRAG